MEASHIHKLSRQVPEDPVQRPNLGRRRRGPSQHPPRDREARVRRDLRGKQISRHRRDVDFHTGGHLAAARRAEPLVGPERRAQARH